LVLDILPGPGGSRPQNLTAIGDALYFSACDAQGCEPFVSDGTAMPPRQVADIAPGAASSGPSFFVRGATRIFAAADDGLHGNELWAIPDASVCAGDCDADRRASIDELIVAVGIGLGARAIDACAAADLDADQAVSINELIAAVRSALDGCAP
jgi:ELWxxDGT repeat protein